MSLLRRRAGGERGAVIVEFTFVALTLSMFAFGVTEFGLAWQDKLGVQTATRAAIRTGSSLRTAPTTDQATLLAAAAGLTDVGLGNVDWVVIYRAASTDGRPPAGCDAPAPQSVTGSCNVYTGAQLQQVAAGTAGAGWFGCGAGSLDAYWCPASRQSVQSLNPDYLGVAIRARHAMLTGLFGLSLNLTDRGVMRLEPAEG